MKRLLLLVLLAPGLCAAQSAAPLLRADRDFAQAVAKEGVEGWMSFMADNAVIMRRQPFVGREAIRTAMQKAFSDTNVTLTWRPTRGQVFKSGDLGYTVGRYEAMRRTEKGESIITRGTYLTVWQKQADGSWKVIWDGGSPDPAAPQTSAAKKPAPAKPKS